MKHPMTPIVIHSHNSHPHTYLTSASNSCSKINLPSLYCSVDSYARSYFHPTTSLQDTHEISRTMCRPVVICRSSGGPSAILTLHPSIPAGTWGGKYTLEKRKALPCWPRNAYTLYLAGKWGGVL